VFYEDSVSVSLPTRTHCFIHDGHHDGKDFQVMMYGNNSSRTNTSCNTTTFEFIFNRPVKKCTFIHEQSNPKKKNVSFPLGNAGRTTKFAPGKSLLELSHFQFRFTVFFTLGCGVDPWIPHLQFFQTVEGKAPKEAWGGHLSGEGINVTFLHPHEPQLSAMRCVTLNQIDPTYMIFVRSFVVLCPHYSTLSSPLPFHCDKISRKGQVFRSFAWSGFIRKLFGV